MKSLIKAAAAMVVLSASAVATASPIAYEGTITPYSPVMSEVGGFGFVRQVASDVDFWSFMANAGTTVTILGTRLDAALDLALDTYFGRTTADDSLFRTGQSWGNLLFVASGDDEIESMVGPFGDPLVTFVVPVTGLYTIAIGGAGSEGEGPYRYALQVTVVPEPGTALLLLAGLGSAAASIRRKKRFGGASIPSMA